MESVARVLVNIIDPQAIDKIIQNTKNMDSRIMLEFLKSLVDLSMYFILNIKKIRS